MSNLKSEKITEKDQELVTSKRFDEEAFVLSYGDVIELLYFVFQNGYTGNDHTRIDELAWDWKVLLDMMVPGWTVESLRELVKEVRNEQKGISG